MLAVTGSLAGAFLGLGYAKAMLHGLATAWREAVGSAPLEFHFTGSHFADGFCRQHGVAVMRRLAWFAQSLPPAAHPSARRPP